MSSFHSVAAAVGAARTVAALRAACAEAAVADFVSERRTRKIIIKVLERRFGDVGKRLVREEAMVRIPSKDSFCQRPDNRDDEGRKKVGDADLLFVPEDVPSDAEDEYTANEGDRIKHVRGHDRAKQA